MPIGALRVSLRWSDWDRSGDLFNSHGRSTDRAPLLLRKPPLEARAVEDVRAGQPLAGAPDRLLADDALFLPGRFLWRGLRRRAREDAEECPNFNYGLA